MKTKEIVIGIRFQIFWLVSRSGIIKGLPPFSSSHPMMSGYPYHQRWLWILMDIFIANPTHEDMVQ
jgi:hypothetical protein